MPSTTTRTPVTPPVEGGTPATRRRVPIAIPEVESVLEEIEEAKVEQKQREWPIIKYGSSCGCW